jgi:hypothetical protein
MAQETEIRLTPTQRQLVELQTPPAPDGKPTSIESATPRTGDETIATTTPIAGNPRQFYVQSAGPDVMGITTLDCDVDVRIGPEVVAIVIPTIDVIVGEPEATSGTMVPIGQPEEIPQQA